MEMPLDAMSEASDDALLVLYANGDRAAAAALTMRLTPIAHGLAMRLLNDRAEAEDVTQEAMLRLWNMAPDWRQGEAKVSTWLYRVVHNLSVDRLRRKKPVGIDDVPEPEDDRPDAEGVLTTRERALALRAALAELPERQRLAVTLRHLEGRGNPEIAEVLELSVEAVESLVARGKRKLSALLVGRKEELGLEE